MLPRTKIAKLVQCPDTACRRWVHNTIQFECGWSLNKGVRCLLTWRKPSLNRFSLSEIHFRCIKISFTVRDSWKLDSDNHSFQGKSVFFRISVIFNHINCSIVHCYNRSFWSFSLYSWALLIGDVNSWYIGVSQLFNFNMLTVPGEVIKCLPKIFLVKWSLRKCYNDNYCYYKILLC